MKYYKSVGSNITFNSFKKPCKHINQSQNIIY